MSHSLDGNKLVVNGTLRLDQNKSQLDDYILISGTFGEASWLKKQDYVPDKDFDHYIGEHFGGGVVTSVWLENGVETCLVVAPQDVSYLDSVDGSIIVQKPMPWNDILNVAAGANLSSFGATNSNLIVAVAGHQSNALYRGAAQYCLDYVNPDLGAGVFNDWYMPSIMELMALSDNMSVVNSVLSQLARDIGQKLMYDDYTNPSVPVPAYIDLLRTSVYNDNQGYWSSTETGSGQALVLDFDIANGVPSAIQAVPRVKSKGLFYRARPFRIATDTQKSFLFDAEWMVLTYKFESGANVPLGAQASDLDTYTRFTSPNLPDSNVGYLVEATTGSGSRNLRGWDPINGTRILDIYLPAQFDANGNLLSDPTLLDNTLIYHGQDNMGTGFETVLINVNRFKQVYPNEASFTIDAKCSWWTNSWSPSLGQRALDYPALTATPLSPGVTNSNNQYWVNLTAPVVVGVKLFKGGRPYMAQNYTWDVKNPTAALDVDSYSKKVTWASHGASMNTLLTSQVKYDVIKKICTLIKV